MPLVLTSPASAAIDPLSGIDFVRIGAVGNPAWAGDGTSFDLNVGRGQVNYEYHIGRFEVNTAQWVEFFNAAFDRPTSEQALPWLLPPLPLFWGATAVPPNNPGAKRWTVSTGQEMHPVGGIFWRMAAMYCNWLCNGKSSAREAFLNGAYDVSTFGDNQNGSTDQATHHPGAKYWIPTLDEWLKASHFDPSKDGGAGGWWTYSNGTDMELIPGPPGVGQANYGFSSPNPYSIPLGAYESMMSPWGLFDVAGGASEWTEGLWIGDGFRSRIYEGSAWGGPDGESINDSIYSFGGTEHPLIGLGSYGFRIATSVPTPSTLFTLGAVCFWSGRRSRSHRIGASQCAGSTPSSLP